MVNVDGGRRADQGRASMVSIEPPLRSARGAATAPVTEDLRAACRALGLAAAVGRIVVEDRISPGAGACVLAARAQRAARRILQLHGVEVSVSGPLPRAPAILVSNHLSYLDPLVMAAVVPCIAIAKGETRGWPLIGSGLHGLGVVFVRRGDAHSGAVALRRACRALVRGTIVHNFPEGTTSAGGPVGPFRRGIFGLALVTGAPIVPAHVAYDDDRVPWFGGAPFGPHYWKLSREPKHLARVTFGQAIVAEAGQDAAALAARARRSVEALRWARGHETQSPVAH
jgi:1-acyl-sn-glycerol-3-phosphate acyltransferase